ncbi:MAG: thioredoxin family protein, partial [Gloeomargaritaceae cyanobacterium C42_A2020_066]|nr:thioredoxin family protein [Gloeomargaritaceae cyanobacterium C42_A2020_066]
PTISQLQAFFGRRTDFIPITVDALSATPSPLKTDPSHYFQGFVPQTVVFDLDGQVVLNQAGAIPYATLDGTLRQVFGLPPVDGPERQAAPVNEVNQELVPPA